MMLANNALTTVDAVKKNLSGTPVELDDDLISQKINEVSQFIETYCDRKFGKSQYTEKHIGKQYSNLFLTHYPVIGIQSIEIDGSVIDDSEYDIDNDSGVVYRECGWPISGNGKRNIIVKYEAGYVLPKDGSQDNPRTLPYDLEGACIVLTTIRYINRDAENLQERRIGDSTEKFINDIPQSIKLMLDSYKRVNV